VAATKIRYQSRSVEQHIDRPRSDIWPDVLAMVRSWEPSAELAVESPWRIAYEMATDGSPLTFWQSTVLIRDDGPTCHVAWGLVFDPEPSDDALAEAERLLEVMSAQLGDLAAGRVDDDAGEGQTA